jgi:hypothetical protein
MHTGVVIAGRRVTADRRSSGSKLVANWLHYGEQEDAASAASPDLPLSNEDRLSAIVPSDGSKLTQLADIRSSRSEHRLRDVDEGAQLWRH